MSGTVLLVGALDTKGVEYAFVKDLIEAAGLETLVVDFGVMGQPAFEPDVSRTEVASAAGGDLAYLASGTHKDEAMRTMAQGLASVVERLYAEGRFDGVLGMGGSGGTSIATAAMRTLPVGVPKLMVSTVGGGDVSAYAGSKDITFMPSVVDVAGINRLSRAIYANAAGAIAGMVKTEAEATARERPLIAASMFGNTTAAVDHARGLLEAEGYEVLVFHATGSGGRTMEDLISDGYIAGCLDMTTTELADDICGGVFSAGPDRVQAAPRQGIPTIVVPGCVDMANFGGIETVPDHYRARTLYEWNPEVTLLRTNAEENRQMGVMLAAAANAGQAGKVSVLIPLGGVSMLDSDGDRFWDPDADQACFDALKNDLRADIPLIEVDANINDPVFAEKAVAVLLEMLQAEP
ncbi:MAG: Tm-1-like ATP-binding domain-containing protein [Caldilineaceae bacterium]|nr:Tm-1-like ATP-binding domain-containing protein [Caldilineaceae bacterium]